nr:MULTISPECIES: DUF302 domain-containing protein [unclassified Methylobacterium]
MSAMSARPVTVEHVTIRSSRDFDTIRQALEAALPSLDHGYAALVQAGRAEEALRLLEGGAPLSKFGERDHGDLLRIAGLERRAIQYDIGNPLTASRMTRHALLAALYAPIHVLLREGETASSSSTTARPAPSGSSGTTPSMRSRGSSMPACPRP